MNNLFSTEKTNQVRKMRESERIDRIIELLRKLWKKHPNQRLGQLLENYIFFRGERGDMTSVQLFYQPDNLTEIILRSKLKNDYQ